ncbi:MAG: AAA family ATPase [Proteobacteria bacterium]|nr:AAA family ATPase [Pseudomonadota bacterium]
MTDQAVLHTDLEPDAQQMRDHLEHLFGGFLDGCQDGLIEITYCDDESGRPKKAKHFGTDEMDEAADFAFEQNKKKNGNIYVGAALRRPDIKRDERAGDADVLALTSFYADLDEKGAAEAAKQIYQDCPPTCAVVTGRHPYKRVQLWWRLSEAAKDLAEGRAQNEVLARTLNGDKTVANPSRVMRLAGSIAWPIKDGREKERTEFHIIKKAAADGTSTAIQSYLPDQVRKAFPAVTPAAPEEAQVETPQLNIGSSGQNLVEDCIKAVQRNDHWHVNLTRLTGHWVAEGRCDLEMMLCAPSFTLSGYTVEQTRREMQAMIDGARKKWNIPNPLVTSIDNPIDIPLAAHFIQELNTAMILPRQWILGRSFLKSYLSVLVAPPGVGKSTLCLAQAVAVITGEAITDQEVQETGRVWIYNNEDDLDELKRRLAAVLQHNDISFTDVRGQLALNSGADRPLLVAKTMPDGTVIRLPDVEACIAHIRVHNIKAFIVDPFVETHRCNENSNEQISLVAQLFREIARRGNCAVVLVHHTAKPPQGSSVGYAGNLYAGRGASALVGVARVIETLFGMSKKDAERCGIPEKDKHLYVRLDDAKANLSLASPDARWFKKISVAISNGDEVGVLEPVTLNMKAVPESDEDCDFKRTIISALLAQVKDPEITLNAAVKLLAWGGHHAFEKYRQSGDGNQRASKSLRIKVIEACQSNIVIVTGDKACGFTVDLNARPAKLKRFERPLDATDIASEPPEIFNDMEDENDT